MQRLSELDAVIRGAVGESAKMLEATAGAADAAKVEMAVSQFRKLAELLAVTARAAGDAIDRFDAPIDGVRLWIPLPQFEAERAATARMREERDQAVLQCGFAQLSI
ncbi:hypothetical protein [Sphingomonas sp.]|uniref:hypothetical protein n=1 Tax=Sphingomonas sp. TaxID=28214 RepID=UPI003AFFA018